VLITKAATMVKKTSGNALNQYGLIIALVALALVPIFFAFGKNITDIFNQYSSLYGDMSTQTKSNTINTVATSTASTSNSTTSTSSTTGTNTSPVVSTETIAGYTVSTHEDGSVSFDIEGTSISLPSKVVELQNIVEETSGSIGLKSLITEIASLVKENKATGVYEPIQILFGDSTRSVPAKSLSVEGTAEVNSTVIKSGSKMIVLVKDQSCVSTNSSLCSTGDTKLGSYVIEGTVGSDNTFNATLTSTTTANLKVGDSSTMIIKTDSNGLSKITGTLNQGYVNFVFDFNNSDYSYTI
jgi:Flp pilus assembly pilin Flp